MKITKQKVQAVADLKAGYTLGHADVAILNELARIALASLEAEPVEWRVAFTLDGQSGSDFDKTFESQAKMNEVISLHERAGFSTSITPLYTAPPATANAEPVAWLWSHRKHKSEVSLVRPEDDERAEGAHWSGWSCQALYAAPPAPVSVPDELAGKSFNYIANKFQVSTSEAQWILVGWNARSAAMLQGAEPVKAVCKLPANTPCKDAPEHIWLQTAGVWPENGEFSELTWCSDNQHPDDTLYVRADVVPGNSPVIPDFLSTVCADAYQVVGVMADALGIFDDEAVQKVMDNLSQQKLVHSDVLPFSLPSTPHKAVTQALTKGMERYGDAMQELAKREAIPDGWVMVPVEPTREMRLQIHPIAEATCMDCGRSVTVDCEDNVLLSWADMLLAAPQQEVKNV